MPAITDFSGMWRAFSEIDVGSMREDAQITPRLAVIGPRDRTSLLEAALQSGPRTTFQLVTAVPTYRFPLSEADLDALASYDLRVALLDSAFEVESDDVLALIAQPGPLVLVIEQPGKSSIIASPHETAGAASVTMVAAWLEDTKSLQKTLLPAIASALPKSDVALSRAYPGLRPAVTQALILRTCMTNSIYAAGTGVAEMVPGLGIPFAVADIIILTKNQLVMAYKIGLIMGETGEFREVLPKLAGVVGAGFMWRQVARESGRLPAAGRRAQSRHRLRRHVRDRPGDLPLVRDRREAGSPATARCLQRSAGARQGRGSRVGRAHAAP